MILRNSFSTATWEELNESLGACRTQGFFIRPPGPNRRPPVPVYQTGWTGYRLKPVKLKFEFKTRSYTGFEHLTGRLDRFTGPIWPVTGRFRLNSKFFLF